MYRLFVLLCLLFVCTEACTVTQNDVWKCITAEKACIRPVDLHRSIRAHSGRLSKPLVLMMEGPRYRKLFEDCDVDRNGCIDLHDIDKAGSSCDRSVCGTELSSQLLSHLDLHRGHVLFVLSQLSTHVVKAMSAGRALTSDLEICVRDRCCRYLRRIHWPRADGIRAEERAALVWRLRRCMGHPRDGYGRVEHSREYCSGDGSSTRGRGRDNKVYLIDLEHARLRGSSAVCIFNPCLEFPGSISCITHNLDNLGQMCGDTLRCFARRDVKRDKIWHPYV